MPDCFSHDWHAYTAWEDPFEGETLFAQVCIDCCTERVVTRERVYDWSAGGWVWE